MADGPKFERNLGSDGSHGIHFEWETTLLTYLRCEKFYQDLKQNNDTGVKSFFVANNVKGVGAFDDVVTRVEYVEQGEVKTKLLLCQCKHVTDATNLGKFQNYLGPKEIQKYFDSFLKVYEIFADDTISDCRQSKMQYSSNEPSEEAQTPNSLKSLFNCNFGEVEFLFLSNIESLPENNPSFSRIKSGKQRFDITTNLFPNAIENEYRLNDEWCLKNLKCGAKIIKSKESIIQEFCKMFRVILKQDDKLDIQINFAMKKCYCKEISAIDILRSTMLEETKLIFDSNSKYSPALTEKTKVLTKIMEFIELKRSSEQILNHYRLKLKLSSKDAIVEIHEKLPGALIIRQSKFCDLEKLKIFRSFTELSEENLFMILRNEEDVEKFNLANTSQTYKHAKKVYVFVERNVKVANGPEKNEIFVQIDDNDVEQSATHWVQQISAESEKIIESTIVNIQGHETTIVTFCSNWIDIFDEQTICKILESEEIGFGRNLPLKSDCYIDRSFKMKELSAKLITEFEQSITPDCKERVLLFFVKNDNGNILEHECKIFQSLGDVRKFKFDVQNKEKTFHCFTYFNGKLNFRYTFGKECQLFEENIVDEDYLSNINDTKITILNDISGMGKSTTMLALAIKYKEKNKSHFVCFTELNKHGCMIENADTIQTAEDAADFVATKLLNFEGIEYDLFINACNVTGNVALFFDAYDELSLIGQKLISELIVILEETKIARIFISSRPKCANELENEILIKSVQFLELLSEERERCLFEFWKKMMKCEVANERKLSQIVNKIISSLKRKENLMNELLAIPLQIKMIAKAYYSTMIKVFKEEIDMNIIDIDLITLYDKFVRSHAEHYFEVKSAGNWINWDTDKKDREIRGKLRGAIDLGFSVVVPEMEIQIMDRRLVLEALHYELGLITNMDPLVFIHRTIAEYLAAKYTVIELLSKPIDKKTANIVKLILSDSKFDVLRKFINSILEITKFPNYFRNQGTRFNIVMKWFSYETPLHIAAFEGNNELLKALLERDNTLVNMKTEHGRTAFHNACSNGKAEAANILLLTNKCIVNTLDRDGDTPLHGASRNALVEIMKHILYIYHSAVDSAVDGINNQNKSGETSLHLAIQSNKVEAVKLLLETQFCDTKILDKGGNNIFHFAARTNSTEIMQLLIENHESLTNMDDKNINTFLHPDNSKQCSNAVQFLLNQKCFRGKTPLHYASSGGHTDMVDLLLKYECSVNECDKDQDTAFHLAAHKNHDKIMENLLKYDVSLINKLNEYGESPLHYACFNGSTDAVEMLIKNKCSVDVRDVHDITAFHLAAKRNRANVMEQLLIYVPSLLSQKRGYAETPLHTASFYGSIDAVELLIRYKCSVIERNYRRETAFHIAASKNHCNIIELLLQCCPSLINIACTALHDACISGHTDAVKLLIKYKCSVNERNSDGDTAFHVAAWGNHVKIMKMLLHCDPSLINQKNTKNRTPLHEACKQGSAGALEFLIKNNCSVNERDRDGDTAFHVAARRNQVKILEMLQMCDPSLINIQNNIGKAPLHLASENCCTDAVKFLLANGSLVDLKDSENRTSLHLAASNDHYKIVKLLKEKAAFDDNSTEKCSIVYILLQ